MKHDAIKTVALFVLVILSTYLGFAGDTYKNGIQYATLNNGQQMPRFGIGTFNVPGDSVAADAVRFALKNGYRHIDTAQAYHNEEGVGAAIRKSGIPRDELFLVSILRACLIIIAAFNFFVQRLILLFRIYLILLQVYSCR